MFYLQLPAQSPLFLYRSLSLYLASHGWLAPHSSIHARARACFQDRATGQWYDLSGTNWSIPLDLGCEGTEETALPPPEPPQEVKN